MMTRRLLALPILCALLFVAALHPGSSSARTTYHGHPIFDGQDGRQPALTLDYINYYHIPTGQWLHTQTVHWRSEYWIAKDRDVDVDIWTFDSAHDAQLGPRLSRIFGGSEPVPDWDPTAMVGDRSVMFSFPFPTDVVFTSGRLLVNIDGMLSYQARVAQGTTQIIH
ncbi:MAG: hypothetical protein ACYCOU_25060, partial [Sulfobacillus sp.]